MKDEVKECKDGISRDSLIQYYYGQIKTIVYGNGIETSVNEQAKAIYLITKKIQKRKEEIMELFG